MTTPAKGTLHVLLAEDSEDDTRLLVRELTRGGYAVTHERVDTAEALRRALERKRWDIMLCDFAFPRFSGQAALRIVRESGLDLPFIYVSGTIGEDVAVEAMKSGAHDYVMKSNLARLVPAVERELREAEDRARGRHAEEAMRVSEHKYRHLFESMSDAAFLIEQGSGRIIDTNAQAESLLARPRATILGMNQFRLHPPPEKGEPLARPPVEIALETPGGHEATVVREDGSIVPVHISASPIELYGRKCLLALFRDIAERKRAEAEREQLTRERLLILESTMEGIYGIDLHGRCTFMNGAAAKMLGHEVAAVLGQDVHKLIHPRKLDGSPYPVEENPIHRALRYGVPCRVESEWFWRSDGTVFPVDYSASPIVENRAIRGAVVAFSDLTEMKQLEDQFLRTQRVESLGQLASGIAHDLNNILAPILIAAPLLRAEIASQKNLTVLDTMESCARRGVDIVEQILTFAKGKGARIVLQPRHLLSEAARFIRETFPRSIILLTDLPDDLCTVSGDVTQLHQVLLNLAVNARDAMPRGGTLRLEAGNVILDKAAASQIPGARPGRYVWCSLADTGEGIPPEIAARIFDPFFTTKGAEKGTGLGLATVKGIIENHRGAIQFTSEAGQGTRFTFYLPAEAAKAAPTLARQPPPAPQGHGELILIADDEEAMRSIMTCALEANGYRTLEATDGAMAVDLYAERRAEIDLVIVDLNMPVMGGVEAISALRHLNPDVRIVIATAAGPAQLSGATGLADYIRLKKPFDAGTLLNALHDALQRPSHAAIA